jgi:transposase InsO family protein
MEGKENLTDVDLEKNPETISTREEDQAQETGLVSSGGDAPGTGRARARARPMPTRKKKRRTHPRSGYGPGSNYPFDFRLRLVKMHVEEGISVTDISKETGVSRTVLFKWLGRYRSGGEVGLRPGSGLVLPGRQQLPAVVKTKMAEIKRDEPTWGVRKISQFMKRFLHLPGSPDTVRLALHGEQLIETKPRRAPKMPTKPRFFERATPNQMWQSDIFTFTMGGKNAYLIGFMDDYSRFMVSLGVFRSQTAEHVLETYRRGVGEYGVPREMLTDNGRQYTNWRGKTRFEQEMTKDKVHHFRSTPHHPQTLGKIERFWQNINAEFLSRARFDSFEQAQERIALWVRHYNHRRPHQGIGGLCPADRFFEIRSELRKVMEKGIEDNLLEIALRGRPQTPFYMIGQVDGQSVVMQASKGKLLMTVGDKENNQKREVLCDLENKKVEVRHENDGDGSREENNGEKVQGAAPAEPVHGGGEGPCGAGVVDGAELGLGTVQGAGDDLEHADPVAGTGDGGDGPGAGAETFGAVREHAAEPAAAGAVGAEGGAEGAGSAGAPVTPAEAGAPAQSGAGSLPARPGVTVPPALELTPELVTRVLQQLLAVSLPAGYVAGHGAVTGGTGGSHAGTDPAPAPAPGREGQAPCATAAGSHGRDDHGDPGGGEAGRVPQDLARVAGPRPGSPGRGDAGPSDGPTAAAGGRGEGAPSSGTPGEGSRECAVGAVPAHPASAEAPADTRGAWLQ